MLLNKNLILDLNEYIIGKNRDDLFLTQTPQAFNLKQIYNLHKNMFGKYKDDDISLYMDLNKVKFIEGEKNNFKITDQLDFNNLKDIIKRDKLLVSVLMFIDLFQIESFI